MRIGSLRRRLTLERETTTADGAGGAATRTWVSLGSVFGAVEPVGRRDGVARERAVGVVTHKVTIRYRADVTRAVRLSDGALRYRVVASEPDMARRTLTLLVSEEQG